MDKLTFSRAAELLAYTPDTGTLIWRTHRGRKAPAGSVAGNLRISGYVQVIVDGRAHGAHRLAWLLATGAWPAGEIDHIDGDKSNNRFSNLRDVTRKVNIENRRRCTKSSRSGLLGVSPRANGKWLSQIQVDGVKHHIGIFDSPEAAHQAYLDHKRRLHTGNTL